jgi:hypothetical protein
MYDLADYIADNYGECVRGPQCGRDGCLRTGWLGRACPHWQPVKAKDWEELLRNNDAGIAANGGCEQCPVTIVNVGEMGWNGERCVSLCNGSCLPQRDREPDESPRI